MPNPNAIVSLVVRLDPPLDRPTDGPRTVVLGDGTQVRIDPADRRAAGLATVLDTLGTLRRPVYVEVDPATRQIARLFVPNVGRVAALRPGERGGLRVELERSHSRDLLPPTSPDFGEFDARLREALRSREPLIVTVDENQEIIDVRAYRPAPDGPFPPFPEPTFPPREPWPWRWLREWLRRVWRWPWWPWWWFGCISLTRAEQIFDAMSATTCNPLTVPPPCIPFMYPDNGCWARAHEMCRLILAMGITPEKVWIAGTLEAATRNKQNCKVNWAWHVAPILCVRGWFLFRRTMVIDPSLFATPVDVATWKGVQGDPNATLTYTAWTDYYWGQTDPTFVDTNNDLATYRAALQARSVQFGPPPYANCP